MKIKLTTYEAHNLIIKALGLPTNTTVVIQRGPRPLPVEVHDLIFQISNMDWKYSQKIQSIKRFREVVSCGLADAKWAVDIWEDTCKWMKENRRFPLIKSVSGSYFLY
jgi:hypothetical protein